MKTGQKILIALGLSTVVGGGFLYYKKKQAAKAEAQPTPIDTPTPTSTPKATPKAATPASSSVDMNALFTKADKAKVMIMQKLIGVVPDGAWGAKTEATINKVAPSLVRPFTLNQLAEAIRNKGIEKYASERTDSQAFAVGTQVYFPNATVGKDVSSSTLQVTSAFTRPVSKGQWGTVVFVNPSSYIVDTGTLRKDYILVAKSAISEIKRQTMSGTDLL